MFYKGHVWHYVCTVITVKIMMLVNVEVITCFIRDMCGTKCAQLLQLKS